jgi:enterochelin esterase-like enzyme
MSLMRDGPWADRLAVWTYTEMGEEIAHGDPSVSDEQRAAAGRETLAQRSRALLPENRRRAAERYAAGDTGGDDAVRVWVRRDPASLRARLDGTGLAVWAERDVLHVVWGGPADRVSLAGGIQPMLWPVEGADDLWEASLRIRRLDECVISVIVFAEGDGRDHRSDPPTHSVWRGPRAPHSRAVATPPAGTIEQHVIESAALRGPRTVTLYRPPGAEGPLPVCILADGESLPGFAGVLEPAVIAGETPPVLLAGVQSAVDPSDGMGEGRTREYVPGRDHRRFRAHLRFVTDEVIPWVRSRTRASTGSLVAAGFSNGAAWAIGAAQRRPDLFSAVAALSPGVVPGRLSGAARAAGVRHYLAAGILEPGFQRSAQQWADRLERADLPVHHEEWAGGHDPEWWQQQFPAALGWLLSSPPLPKR